MLKNGDKAAGPEFIYQQAFAMTERTWRKKESNETEFA
jgi:hypothetical protein